MTKFAYKKVLAVAAAVATLVAAPGAAEAAPQPRPLKAQLLTAADLPSGYEAGDPSEDWSKTDRVNFGNVCTLLGSVTTPDGEKTHQAANAYTKDTSELAFALEMLADSGDRKARAAVAATAAAPQQCGSTTENGQTLSVYPMEVPALGDAAAGVRFAVRSSDGVIHGKEIVIAKNGVSIAVFLIGQPKQDRLELEKIAAAAARKV